MPMPLLLTLQGMADFHATVDGAVVTIHGPFATGPSDPPSVPLFESFCA